MIDYEEDWLFLLIFRYRGSVAAKAAQFAVPAALFAFALRMLDYHFPEFEETADIVGMTSSTLWTASSAILVLMLNVRTNRAMARFWEGTGLLHQMRGEWFDAVSCCITFSTIGRRTKPEEAKEFRHCIVRLMSLCHAIALAEIADKSEPPITIDSYGLNNDTLKHLIICKEDYGFNRVEVLLHMTQTLIVNALDNAVLKIPPPILSRVFQTLSRGFVNLLNAKKITDTRFPFPYAQLITILLFLHMVMTPVMISNLIKSEIWASIFAFVPIFGMFSLNYVAIELENPFGDDDNDLPMLHFQQEMNNCLLMLLEDNADMVASTSRKRCIRDFKTLKKSHIELEDAPLDKASIRQASAFGPKTSTTGGMDDFLFEPEPEEDEQGLGDIGDITKSSFVATIEEAPAAPEIDTSSTPAPEVTQSSPAESPAGPSTEAPAAENQAAPIPSQSPPVEDPRPATATLAIESQGASTTLASQGTLATTAASQGSLATTEAPVVEQTLATSKPAAETSPARVALRLENLESMLMRSVETVERTFEQWMVKAEDHAQALRRNTEAITQLVMVHV